MSDWKAVLKADPLPWLLEDDNPSVQYSTLVDIMGEPDSSLPVREAKSRSMETGTWPKIWERQNPEVTGG